MKEQTFTIAEIKRAFSKTVYACEQVEYLVKELNTPKWHPAAGQVYAYRTMNGSYWCYNRYEGKDKLLNYAERRPLNLKESGPGVTAMQDALELIYRRFGVDSAYAISVLNQYKIKDE